MTWRVLFLGWVAGWLVATPLVALAGWDTFAVIKNAQGTWTVQPTIRTLLQDAMGAGWLETPVSGRTVKVGATAAVPVGASSAGMQLGYRVGGLGLSKLLAKAIPVVSTGMAAYEVAQAIRCYAAPGSSGWGGLLECDAGVDQVTTTGTQWRLNDYGTPWRWSAAETWTDYKGYLDAHHGACSPGYSWGSYVSTSESTNFTAVVYGGCAAPYVKYQHGISSRTGSDTACPASVDPLDPANSVPAGEPVGLDGKCRTARYNGHWSAADSSVVDTKLGVVPDATLRPDQIARNALSVAGQAAEDLIRENPAELSGPASVNGPTTTTTPPGGSPVTSTVVYNITYEGDTYNYSETATAGDGTVTTGPPSEKVEVCGLPGKPACKIDETGTPTTGNLSAADAALTAAQAARVTELSGPAHGQSSLPWSFSFGLPAASCTPFEYVSRIGTITADPCTSSGVALWRSLLAWFLAGLTGLYIWRSVSELSI